MTLSKMLKGMLNNDLLVTPRYEQYLATHPNIEVDQALMDFVREELTEPERKRTGTFSASSSGRCLRQQVLRYLAIPERGKLNSDLHAIFHDGTFRHIRWQLLLMEAGALTDVEVPVVVPKYDMSGTIDGLNQDEGFGWELKGINDRGYRWVLQKGPSRSHLLQIHAYMFATNYDTWSLVYENKNDQTWKEFVIERDDALIQEVKDDLEFMYQSLQKGRLPAIQSECLSQTGDYKRCPFAYMCLETDGWPEKLFTDERKPQTRRIRRP